MPVRAEPASSSFNVVSLKDEAAASCKSPREPTTDRLAGFTVVRRLRRTLYGDTTLCRKSDDQLVVLKRMSLQALRDNSVGAHESPVEERRVIRVLERAGGHAHIVRYERNADGASMFVHRGQLYTTMEFCEDGDLFDHLERQPLGRVSEREALAIVQHVAEALAFLHAHDVAHRDLSLENVLLHHGTAKVCDFGLSCDASHRYEDVVGKVCYMAPEVARGESYDPAAADLWSLGVILFTLITGSPLVADEVVRDKMLRVIAKYGVVKVLELWGMRGLVSTATLALLTSLLQVDPTKRPRAQHALAHPAFWPLLPRRA